MTLLNKIYNKIPSYRSTRESLAELYLLNEKVGRTNFLLERINYNIIVLTDEVRKTNQKRRVCKHANKTF